MKTFLLILLLLVVGVIVYFFILGTKSKNGEVPGLDNGRLSQCSSKPNCVCSEQNEKGEHHIAPIALTAQSGNALAKMKALIQAEGGVVTSETETYLAATFTSGIFRFVDDVELRLDEENKLLHIRSASRVGHSDLGANRKRVNQLTELFGE